MSRPTMRFVPVKTAEQRAALMLIGVRERLISNRTQLSNKIRGFASEFGLAAAKGVVHLDPLLERLRDDESLPALARELFNSQAQEFAQLQTKIEVIDAKLAAWQKTEPQVQRLAKIPKVALVLGTLVAETILASALL